MFEELGNKRPARKVEDNAGVWRPTGEGNYPRISLRPEAGTSAYMCIHDVGVEPDEKTPKMHLWAYEITFGWSMEYVQSQTAFGKSFYPRHMRVGNVVVKCQTASQHHYDEIVKQILDYQKSAVLAEDDNRYAYKVVRFEIPEAKYKINSMTEGDRYPKVTGATSDDETIYKYGGIFFDGYPISIAAGHKKFVYQPEVELTFAVVSYKNDVPLKKRINSQDNPNEDPFGNQSIQDRFKQNVDPNNGSGSISATSAYMSGYTELPNGTYVKKNN